MTKEKCCTEDAYFNNTPGPAETAQETAMQETAQEAAMQETAQETAERKRRRVDEIKVESPNMVVDGENLFMTKFMSVS